MHKKCDNTSVGMIVRDSSGRILLIERKKYNPGFALPAGHEDGYGAEKTAIKELLEEVGLNALFLRPLLLLTLKNTCRREGGSFHRWTIFAVERWNGDIQKNKDEVKWFIWADKEMLMEFVHRLEKFMEENKLSVDNLPALVKATNESESWKRAPGLEPAMYLIFKELKII